MKVEKKILLYSWLLPEHIIKIWQECVKKLYYKSSKFEQFFSWKILCTSQNHIFQVKNWQIFNKKENTGKHLKSFFFLSLFFICFPFLLIPVWHIFLPYNLLFVWFFFWISFYLVLLFCWCFSSTFFKKIVCFFSILILFWSFLWDGERKGKTKMEIREEVRRGGEERKKNCECMLLNIELIAHFARL